MKEERKQLKNNILPLILLVIAVVLSFWIFEFKYMPHDFDNMGGKHIWVSGSTIKFVNMWLEEGPANLHFTNYEYFPSVEHQSLESRRPYVSYPTGVTYMVWQAAKICGVSRIDISFLKHYQLILYAIETMIITLLLYVLVLRFKKNAYSSALYAFALTLFWMTLPVNNWFMTNIFWTDIAVLFWVILFLFLESISDVFEGKLSYVIKGVKAAVVFAGILTEYYFYIVVFLAFIINVARIFLISEKKGGLKKTFLSSLQYVVPVFAGIAIYLWQLSFTDNWLKMLTDTFLHRTGAENNEASISTFVENFCQAIVCGSRLRALLLLVAFAIIITLFLIKHFNIQTLRTILVDRAASTIVLLIITPIVQIVVFSNHSAIHQYSMVKFGFVLIGFALLSIITTLDFKNIIFRIMYPLGVFMMVLLAMGYPGQPLKFYYEKNQERYYDIAKAIYNNTGFEDICISYSYVIDFEPPMDISVSEKCVNEITDTEDVEYWLNSIPNGARLILVIDKNHIGSNDFVDREITDEILYNEDIFINRGVILYEDENCALVNLSLSNMEGLYETT